MTLEELNSLRFNMPIHSNIDNTLWYYHSRVEPNGVKIFKHLVDTSFESMWRGRSYYRTNETPWKLEGELNIPVSMILEDFDLVYRMVKTDIQFIKKDKQLVTPISIVKPNFHMILPF